MKHIVTYEGIKRKHVDLLICLFCLFVNQRWEANDHLTQFISDNPYSPDDRTRTRTINPILSLLSYLRNVNKVQFFCFVHTGLISIKVFRYCNCFIVLLFNNQSMSIIWYQKNVKLIVHISCFPTKLFSNYMYRTQ